MNNGTGLYASKVHYRSLSLVHHLLSVRVTFNAIVNRFGLHPLGLRPHLHVVKADVALAISADVFSVLVVVPMVCTVVAINILAHCHSITCLPHLESLQSSKHSPQCLQNVMQ